MYLLNIASVVNKCDEEEGMGQTEGSSGVFNYSNHGIITRRKARDQYLHNPLEHVTLRKRQNDKRVWSKYFH